MKSTAHPLAGDPLGIPPGVEGRVSEWRDIASAPKDGTWFMIGREGCGPEEYEIGKYEPQGFSKYTQTLNGLYRKTEVIINAWRGFNNFDRATHWMPIPSAPVIL